MKTSTLYLCQRQKNHVFKKIKILLKAIKGFIDKLQKLSFKEEGEEALVFNQQKISFLEIQTIIYFHLLKIIRFQNHSLKVETKKRRIY